MVGCMIVSSTLTAEYCRVEKEELFMAFRKKTLRTMSPTARKVARLVGELDSISRRLKNLMPDLQRLDLDSKALEVANQTYDPLGYTAQDIEDDDAQDFLKEG